MNYSSIFSEVAGEKKKNWYRMDFDGFWSAFDSLFWVSSLQCQRWRGLLKRHLSLTRRTSNMANNLAKKWCAELVNQWKPWKHLSVSECWLGSSCPIICTSSLVHRRTGKLWFLSCVQGVAVSTQPENGGLTHIDPAIYGRTEKMNWRFWWMFLMFP